MQRAGLLTVKGPLGTEDQNVEAGVNVTIGPFTGTALSSNDFLAAIPISGSCGSSDQDLAINAFQSAFVPLTESGGSTTADLAVADLPKGGQWNLCYCADFQDCNAFAEFQSPAGILTVRGADGVGVNFCVKNEVQCLFNVSGTGLASTDFVLVRPQGIRGCRAAASTSFGENPADTTSGTAGSRQFDVAVPAEQGFFYICYCATHSVGCSATTDFTHEAGILVVRGPAGGEDQSCRAGVACVLQVTGQTLATTDRVSFVPNSGTCGTTAKDAATEIANSEYKLADASVLPTISTLDSGTLSERSIDLGVATVTTDLVAADLPKGGLWKVCYCATHDADTSGVCNSQGDFTAHALTLTVIGASGMQAFHCVKDAAGGCGFTVDGTALVQQDNVQVVADGSICGTASPVATFGTSRAQAGFGGTTTQQLFTVGVASLQGEFEVCYCTNYDYLGGASPCDDNVEFTHTTGSLTVRGPVGSEDQSLLAGVSQNLGPFSGQGLTTADMVALVPYPAGVCGTAAPDAATEIGTGVSQSILTDLTAALVPAELPKGGVWRICYCTDYDADLAGVGVSLAPAGG